MPGGAMTKPRTAMSARSSSSAHNGATANESLASEHYRREKARRARHTPADSEAMASARREYQALLETAAVKGRGGRPKKSPPKPAEAEFPQEDESDIG